MPQHPSENRFTLENLVIAYRHTKAELFRERPIPSQLDLLKYEEDLLGNLKKLLININNSLDDCIYGEPNASLDGIIKKVALPSKRWIGNGAFLGRILQQPKAVEPTSPPPKHSSTVAPHLHVTDAKLRWETFKKENRPSVSFRAMAIPSIDFQILGMLWITKVGSLLDQRLLPSCRGNRLQRIGGNAQGVVQENLPLNVDGPQIFQSYYSAYRDWREDGLKVIGEEVQHGNRVIAVTMDLQRYFDQIDPKVLGNDDFWESTFQIYLDPQQKHLTALLTAALIAWADQSPKKKGIPVGLLASKIISNALLFTLDKAVSDKLKPVFYARYVDDILLVIHPTKNMQNPSGIIGHIATELGDLANLEKDKITLRLDLPNVGESTLKFGAAKQRIFDFNSSSGKDLLDTIKREIDELSSEFRLMPEVSDEAASVLTHVLIADSNPELGADSLRKADSLTIRRLGLAILIRNHEILERCMLDSKQWTAIRAPFYKLMEEHVLTPERYGTYFQYLPRIFGLIAATGDWEEGERLLKRIEWVQKELEALKLVYQEK